MLGREAHTLDLSLPNVVSHELECSAKALHLAATSMDVDPCPSLELPQWLDDDFVDDVEEECCVPLWNNAHQLPTPIISSLLCQCIH